MNSKNVFKLNITKQAKNDIDEITQYLSIELSSPQAARNMLEGIEKAFTNIKRFPFTGQTIERKYENRLEYRRYGVKNYNIYYLIDSDIVYIMKIMHQRRSYDNLT